MGLSVAKAESVNKLFVVTLECAQSQCRVSYRTGLGQSLENNWTRGISCVSLAHGSQSSTLLSLPSNCQ